MVVVKRYVEKLGGTISFESNYGSGTIFYVSIPQKVGNDTPISQVPISSDKVVAKDCKNKKVLILDDDDYSANKLANILKKYNLVPECIKSGKDAVNMIKSDSEYDLIIINENLRDIGFSDIGRLLKYLKNSLKIPPLIGLVVNSNRYINENYYDEFLLKPISLKRLDEIIQRRCL